MKAKSFLAFLVAFMVGSVIVYCMIRSQTADLTTPVEPYVFKTYPPIDFVDPEEIRLSESIRKMMGERDYKGLDSLAATLSQQKSRLRGGKWQIFNFDDLVAKPDVEEASAEAWNSHIAFIRSWVKASPQSIYAKTALANAEVNFGTFYRGEGYARSVPESAWPKYLAHLAAARTALAEAEKLSDKYVGYHSAVLQTAMLDGADRSAYEKAYQAAVAFEPLYDYFYMAKAHYLMPRWGGQWGDSETFAERVKIELGGDDGVKMYSVIIAELGRVNSSDYVMRNRIVWKDVLRGFELREAAFGTNRWQLNELARLSVYKNDHETTCNVFRRLDSAEAYEPAVWGSRAEFNSFRAMAINSTCDSVKQKAELHTRFPHLAEQEARSRQTDK